jgi:hypothetical protein
MENEDEYDSQEEADYVAEKMAYYIEIGAIELEGVDENGEIIYQITELAQELAPELWAAHEEYVNDSMIDLYQRGLVEIEYDENLEATFKISPEGIQAVKEYGLLNGFESMEDSDE